MDKVERTTTNKLCKAGSKDEFFLGKMHNKESEEMEECPRSSSFLFGGQLCNFDLSSPKSQKRQSVENFNEDNGKITHYKKLKSSASPTSIDEGSTSTFSDEDKDFSYYSTPQINPTTCMGGDLSKPSQYSNYPKVPYLKSTESKQRANYNHYPSYNHRTSGKSFTTNFLSSIKQPGMFPYIVEGGEDRNDGLGSELLTAAYNNFVRKLVDETLDRTITFCEQPRNAISALERICSKVWPQLEAKRHRNRIRAYLKACRRNSKKNRGQINMKEPPMNALSAEARQIVVTAMNLARKDIEQLREDLKRDKSPSVFTAKNETLPQYLRRSDNHSNLSLHQPGLSTKPANSFVNLTAKSSRPIDDHYSLPKSGSFHSLFSSIPHLSKSSNVTNTKNTPAWLDPHYLSTLMRFLPSSAHFKTDSETSFHPAATNRALGVKLTDWNETGYNIMERKPSKQATSALPSHPPPAAHFAVAKYSPTLNQATSMLLEVRPLSQDDLEYFQRYQDLMNEAIEYARGVSQMLMKKVEMIEGYIKESNCFCKMAPINCANN